MPNKKLNCFHISFSSVVAMRGGGFLFFNFGLMLLFDKVKVEHNLEKMWLYSVDKKAQEVSTDV